MDRSTIARTELINDLIAEKESQLARLQSSACDPRGATLDRIGGKRCGNLREDQLLNYFDNAAEIQQSIDRLRLEQEALHCEIMEELQKTDFYVRTIVKGRLLRGYTWAEVADLTGYCERTCHVKYDKWISSFL